MRDQGQRRIFLAVVMLMLLATVLSACAAPAGTGAPAAAAPVPTKSPEQAKTLSILYWQAPTILNSHQASGTKDFDAAGVMEVPTNAATVAWYGFTAMPGDPGNAVLAGHVTWGGARAVFNQLSALHTGDTVEVRTGDGDLRYVVQRSYLVKPEEADIRAIIGPRDGPQTLTLITCGGSFDPSVREYDHRVIVFATRA